MKMCSLQSHPAAPAAAFSLLYCVRTFVASCGGILHKLSAESKVCTELAASLRTLSSITSPALFYLAPLGMGRTDWIKILIVLYFLLLYLVMNNAA